MERDDGGVVLALRGLERGLVVPAADRLVRAVLQQLQKQWPNPLISANEIVVVFALGTLQVTGTDYIVRTRT